MKYLIWITGEACSGLLYYWPVTLILVALVLTSLIAAIIKKEPSIIKNSTIAALPLLGTVLILVSGSFFKQNREFGFVPLVGALFVVFLTPLAIYRTKKTWFLSLSISALIWWFSLHSLLMSAMSIADDWM